MAREGMDVGVITHDGTQMKEIGENSIPGVISTVEGIVNELHSVWWGDDSRAFHESWESHYRPNLTTIAHEISAFGGLAITNAQEQSSASAAGSGTV